MIFLTKRCPVCSGRNEDEAKFCRICGEKFKEDAEKESSILSLLRSLKGEVENGIKPHLNTLIIGHFVKGNLPQTWNFVTEQERAWIDISVNGDFSAGPGAQHVSDVTIEWLHYQLLSALRNRKNPGGPRQESQCIRRKGRMDSII